MSTPHKRLSEVSVRRAALLLLLAALAGALVSATPVTATPVTAQAPNAVPVLSLIHI